MPASVRRVPADGDAEVAELEAAVRAEQEVLRLHVAVDETCGMSRCEPGAHLHAERRRLPCGQPAAARHELRERLSLDVLHRDERPSAVLAHIEDAHDVRVREPRRQACLAQEAPPQLLVPGEVLGEPLQRHRAVELDVMSEIDRRHRSVPERTDELVAAGNARHRAHLSPL